MSRTVEKLFRAPYGVPNALQVVEEGLWITDQITDRVALIEIAEPSEYGVTRLIRDIPSESSNTSGMAWGGGSLWLAANGAAALWRPARPTDAEEGEIFEVDPDTGATRNRYPVPGGGGVHGMEYDPFEEGHVWITTLKSQTLSKVKIADVESGAELAGRSSTCWICPTGARTAWCGLPTASGWCTRPTA